MKAGARDPFPDLVVILLIAAACSLLIRTCDVESVGEPAPTPEAQAHARP